MIFALLAATDKENSTRYFGGDQLKLLVCRPTKPPMNEEGVFDMLSQEATNNLVIDRVSKH